MLSIQIGDVKKFPLNNNISNMKKKKEEALYINQLIQNDEETL